MTRFALKDVPFEFTDREVVYVCGEFKGSKRKIFRIQFWRDGSIFIQMPYFSKSEGLLSYIRLFPGQKYPNDEVSLMNGKTTTQKVKYTHHPDGEAHFSQDGKILTEIRRSACPFVDMDGHFFTCMFRGYENFKEISKNEKFKPNKKHIHIGFSIDHEDAEKRLCKYICSVMSFDALCEELMPQYRINGAKFSFVAVENNVRKAIKYRVIRNPFSPRKDQVLLLGCDVLDADSEEPWLSFMGGFDHKSIALDHTKPTEALALNYGPFNRFKELASHLGSVDYVNDSNRKGSS